MTAKLIVGIVLVFFVLFVTVGLELMESLRGIRLSEEDVNNSFKDVRK